MYLPEVINSMSLTNAEEKRIQTVETALALHATAIKNLASKRQLNHVLALVERQVKAINDEISSIKTQIEALKK